MVSCYKIHTRRSSPYEDQDCQYFLQRSLFDKVLKCKIWRSPRFKVNILRILLLVSGPIRHCGITVYTRPGFRYISGWTTGGPKICSFVAKFLKTGCGCKSIVWLGRFGQAWPTFIKCGLWLKFGLMFKPKFIFSWS